MRAQQLKVWARGLLSAAIVLLLASACGGVDSGGTGAVSIGPVTGFGSIIVNGVRFDDSAAAIQDDDGVPLTRDRLMLGVMMQIDASAPNGVPGGQRAFAKSVRISSEVVGPVSAVDLTIGSLTVLGQTVRVTPATVFETGLTGGLAALPPGTIVEIHGRHDAANNRYTATRIETKPNATSYKLRGPVLAFDPSARTLRIGDQTIDYSQIPLADLPNVVVGNIVRARLQPTTGASVLTAVALPLGVPQLPDRAVAVVEGRISAWTSSRRFSVNGVQVDASGASFPAGEAGVVIGARVSVQGTSIAGELHARIVDVEGDEDASNSLFELEGRIGALDTVAKTFTLDGVTVDYSGPVQYQSGTVADLAVGRQVEVVGTLLGAGAGIKAQRIDFETR
jgi:hypothetical protein